MSSHFIGSSTLKRHSAELNYPKKKKRRHDWVEFLNGNSTQDHLSMNSNGFSILPQKSCKNHQDSVEQNSRSPHSDSIVRILFLLVKSTRTWGIRNNFPNKNPPIPTAKQTKDIQKGVEINLNKNEIKKKTLYPHIQSLSILIEI